jgi:hypothetical protein
MREHFETPIASKLLLSFLCTIFFGIPLAIHAHDDFPEDAFTDPPPTHLPIDHPDRIRKPEYQHVHEYYQVNNMHPPNLIRITAWWTVEPQNWQSSDPDTPNQIGNLQNFKNDDLGNNGDDNLQKFENDDLGNNGDDSSQNNRRDTSSSSGEGCTPLTGEIVSFTLELKEGYNFISLPFTVIGVDHCENALEEIADLFYAIQPDVNYIYSVGLDEFKYTLSGGDNPELDPSFGFVIVMTRERTVELHAQRPETTPVQVDFTIREGYGVYGVPIDSDDLETVGDFFDLFPSVWAIYFQLESQDQVLVQRNDTEYLDESIRGEASYMIHSSAEETVTLEGELWETETASPAPQLKPTIPSVITTWAQLKIKSESKP